MNSLGNWLPSPALFVDSISKSFLSCKHSLEATIKVVESSLGLKQAIMVVHNQGKLVNSFLMLSVTEHVHDPINIPALKRNWSKIYLFIVHCQIYLMQSWRKYFKTNFLFLKFFGKFWCSCYSDMYTILPYYSSYCYSSPICQKHFFQKSCPLLLCIVTNQNKLQRNKNTNKQITF